MSRMHPAAAVVPILRPPAADEPAPGPARDAADLRRLLTFVEAQHARRLAADADVTDTDHLLMKLRRGLEVTRAWHEGPA